MVSVVRPNDPDVLPQHVEPLVGRNGEINRAVRDPRKQGRNGSIEANRSPPKSRKMPRLIHRCEACLREQLQVRKGRGSKKERA